MARSADHLGRLVRDYGERAFQLAFHLAGDAERARELVQEAFYRVLKGWATFDPEQSLENWYCTVLRNIYLDGVRSFEHRRVVSIDTASADEDAEPEAFEVPDGQEALLDLLDRRESAALVRRALQRLTAEHRMVLSLCDVEGLDYERIASVLGCPLGTVRSRVARARGALRRRLLEADPSWVGSAR